MITRLFILNSLTVVFVCIFGDHTLGYLKSRWKLALVDNSTHALVAFFTWFAITSCQHYGKTWIILEGLACALVASLVDSDHFISASSFSIIDATNLKGRPFLHNSTLVIWIFALTLTLSFCLGVPGMWTFSWIILAAGVSHHVRDATRRGLWFWPLGSTPPIPYAIYIFIEFILPLIISQLMQIIKMPHSVRPTVEVI